MQVPQLMQEIGHQHLFDHCDIWSIDGLFACRDRRIASGPGGFSDAGHGRPEHYHCLGGFFFGASLDYIAADLFRDGDCGWANPHCSQVE